MRIDLPTPVLAGLSPAQFMRRHWQKKPLLVRGAMPGVGPPVERAALFALAARDDVESRLVLHDAGRWRLRHGPFARRALPPLARPNWTLLVQGLDLHNEAAHELLMRFRFVPDARLDDLMLSYASDGGGVGPHVDSYDVFLLQVHGARRWRIARVRDAALREDVPLAMLRSFEPEAEWLLGPGDMLYLPPDWAHEGVAEGECMTCSIGFRAAGRGRLGRDVLQALLDADAGQSDRLYADARQPATAWPARIPGALQRFAQQAVRRLAGAPCAIERALGEVLSEPKPAVVFERRERALLPPSAALRLDRRSRMMYDERHVYLNGESYRARGRAARLMRLLADARRLAPADTRRLGAEVGALVAQWLEAGWLHAAGDEGEDEQ